MTTATEWFESVQDKELRELLLLRQKEGSWSNGKAYRLSNALIWGFRWEETPEGDQFWREKYELFKSLEML